MRSSQLLTRMLLRVRDEFARMKVDDAGLHPLSEVPGRKLETAPQVVNHPAGAAAKMIEAALFDPEHREVHLPTGDSAASRPNLNTLQQMIVDYLDSRGFIYDGQSSVASIFIMDLQTGEEINLLVDFVTVELAGQ